MSRRNVLPCSAPTAAFKILLRGQLLWASVGELGAYGSRSFCCGSGWWAVLQRRLDQIVTLWHFSGSKTREHYFFGATRLCFRCFTNDIDFNPHINPVGEGKSSFLKIGKLRHKKGSKIAPRCTSKGQTWCLILIYLPQVRQTCVTARLELTWLHIELCELQLPPDSETQ